MQNSYNCMEHYNRKVESFSYCAINSATITSKRSLLRGLNVRQYALCELEQDCKILKMERIYISVLRYFSLHNALLKCTLVWPFQKCPLSSLERCPSHGEYSWLKIGTDLRQVSVKTELTGDFFVVPLPHWDRDIDRTQKNWSIVVGPL